MKKLLFVGIALVLNVTAAKATDYAVVVGAVVNGVAMAQGESFRSSCMVTYEDNAVVQANCRGIDGRFYYNSLVKAGCYGDIINYNGVLQCDRNPPSRGYDNRGYDYRYNGPVYENRVPVPRYEPRDEPNYGRRPVQPRDGRRDRYEDPRNDRDDRGQQDRHEEPVDRHGHGHRRG